MAGRIVVLGGGQAAGRSVLAMRKAGFQGHIALIGNEAHLPYERPSLSKQVLLDPTTPETRVFDEAQAAKEGIDLYLGSEAVDICRSRGCVSLDDGRELSYERLLIATGCRIRRLTIEGREPGAVHHLRTIDDARALAGALGGVGNVVVVGGGFIGLEVARAALKRGRAVTVLEAAERLLPRMGCAEASHEILRLHRAAGIDVRVGVGARRGEGLDLILTNGERIRAEVVVAGIGVQPNVELAAAAGIEVKDGVVTDEYGRTSDPLICAAGDVTFQYHPLLGRHVRLESWQNANVQAEGAARTLVGEPTRTTEPPWVWSDQGDLNIQIAGAPGCVDQTFMRGAEGDGMAYFQFWHGRLVGGVTLNRGKDMAIIRRWLTQSQTPTDLAALVNEAIPLRKIPTDSLSHD